MNKLGDKDAFRVERGGDEKWVSWTWKKYYGGCFFCDVAPILLRLNPLPTDDAVQFARALLSIGYQVCVEPPLYRPVIISCLC